jgi:putative phage-type endonuclease
VSAIALPVRLGTPEWIEARLDGITSTDAAVIAREKGSLVSLWAEKRRLAAREEPDPDTLELMEWGRRLEDAIALGYTEKTDRPVKRVGRLMRHASIEWARTSLDRISARKGERRVIELKNTRWKPRKQGDEIPGDVYAQVQHQLFVMEFDVADLVTFVGGNELLIDPVERDDAYIDDLVYLERDFRRHVELAEMPRMDGSEATAKTLARLHERTNGLWLPGTAATDDLAAQLRDAITKAKAAEEREKTLRNAFRALIEEADGVAGDFYRVAFRRNADSRHVTWEKVAAAYRALLAAIQESGDQSAIAAALNADLDAIESLYSEVRPGPRVLVPRFFEVSQNQAA